jgi:hypothetical protein
MRLCLVGLMYAFRVCVWTWHKSICGKRHEASGAQFAVFLVLRNGIKRRLPKKMMRTTREVSNHAKDHQNNTTTQEVSKHAKDHENNTTRLTMQIACKCHLKITGEMLCELLCCCCLVDFGRCPRLSQTTWLSL